MDVFVQRCSIPPVVTMLQTLFSEIKFCENRFIEKKREIIAK
jgi:hypothetical protein